MNSIQLAQAIIDACDVVHDSLIDRGSKALLQRLALREIKRVLDTHRLAFVMVLESAIDALGIKL